MCILLKACAYSQRQDKPGCVQLEYRVKNTSVVFLYPIHSQESMIMLDTKLKLS